MMRVLFRIAASVIVLAVTLMLVLWAYVRASLPDIEGSVTVAGLDAPASIERDKQGIPVITAATRTDLAFATGYAHAQDRFFQMDLIRRQAAGELSAVFGAIAVDTDKRYRLHRFRDLAREVLDASSDADRKVLEHYARGVNAGLASLGAKPFEYLLLREDPQPWTAEDTVLVVYAMFMQLNDSRARKDVRRGFAHRALPHEVYDCCIRRARRGMRRSWAMHAMPRRSPRRTPTRFETGPSMCHRHASAVARRSTAATTGLSPGP